MKKLKWSFTTFVISSFCIFIYLFLIKKSVTIQSISDTFFIVSLFFLIIGMALWIMSSGFFDNFQYFMKKTLHLRKKNEPKEYIPFSEIGKAHRLYWLTTGGCLLIPAIVSLLFYFF
ncbi:DUF3899 domain-containing protein [Enterococcus sp. BWB1-3]|uniref:DUF3899 domain-containing protein n=1 Tax=Enterococcus sp. BWB1-3 TaxID=2787713 RepID=UPI001922065D|nr:DUF3899 domain-containing protein [Enterococcus sp. BWB1-3]MBL1227761.1 DUF3899 domain-containing protein [Enterococcus sp. BWB1-3]